MARIFSLGFVLHPSVGALPNSFPLFDAMLFYARGQSAVFLLKKRTLKTFAVIGQVRRAIDGLHSSTARRHYCLGSKEGALVLMGRNIPCWILAVPILYQ